MKFTTGRVLFALVVLALAGLAWWVYENMEIREMKVPGEPRGEARRNDLLAAQRLVSALGGQTDVRYAFALPPGPPRDAVLVFPTLRRAMTAPQRAALLKWVEDGGHLVAVTYTVSGSDDAPDPTLSAVGISQFVNRPKGKRAAKQTDKQAENQTGKQVAASPAPGNEDGEDNDNEDKDSAPAPSVARNRSRFAARSEIPCPMQQITQPAAAAAAAATAGTDSSAISATVPAAASDTAPEAAPMASLQPIAPAPVRLLSVCFEPMFRLQTKQPKLWQATDPAGVHALAVTHGKGRVTVLTDYDFMMNSRIGAADHADFFLELIAFHPGLRVWFIPREDIAGITRLTWQYG